MKTKLFLLSILISFVGYSQIPANYYDSATGSGYTLKTQLKNIIDSDNDGLSPEFQSTDPGYAGLYTTYTTSDIDLYYENNGTMLDMYSENPVGTDAYEYTYGINQDNGTGGTTEGQFYNREHIIPQSVFSEVTPQRSDAHFVVPSDKYVNGQRGSLPFGRVETANLTTTNGSKRGNNIDAGYSAGYTGTVFEPIDEFKGDIARMHLYFATRYEDNVAGYTYTMFNGTSDQVFDDTFLSILVTWHLQDPVSTRERDRNDAIFARQNNRNPFIDHPEYVQMIWNATVDTEAPTVPTNLMVSNETSNSIDLSWNASTDNTAVTEYDVYVNSVFNTSVSTTNTTVTGLSSETTFAFTVLAKDATGNASAQSNSINGTTLAGGGGSATELFISEYEEGSGRNKALEIANFTGSTVMLADYELRLSSNGNANWTATYTFPNGASIADGDVFTIINTSFALTCTNLGTIDDSNNSITGFNGNDAIGLFKNNTLIDALGTLGNNSAYAENTTLVRKETIISPNTVYNANEWNTFSSNTCDDLGIHTVSLLSIVDINLDDLFKAYPNPSINGSITIHIPNSANNELNVYDITGKRIVSEKNITETVQLSNLPQGMLLVEIISSQRSITKKVIVR